MFVCTEGCDWKAGVEVHPGVTAGDGWLLGWRGCDHGDEDIPGCNEGKLDMETSGVIERD